MAVIILSSSLCYLYCLGVIPSVYASSFWMWLFYVHLVDMNCYLLLCMLYLIFCISVSMVCCLLLFIRFKSGMLFECYFLLYCKLQGFILFAEIVSLTTKPNITVAIPPPMNPSQVFFGESWMRGVLPKKNPNTYAITSLQTIIETGTINLKHSEHYFINLS